MALISFSFLFIFIGLQLIYNIVLVSAARLSESFLDCFPIQAITQFRVVSCTIQQVYLFYMQQSVYVNPDLPIYSFLPYPLVTIKLFSTSVTLCFVNKFICIIFQIPDISDIICYFSFSLIYFTHYDNLQVHPLLQTALLHIFLWLSDIPLYYIYVPHFSLSIPWSMNLQVTSMSWLL